MIKKIALLLAFASFLIPAAEKKEQKAFAEFRKERGKALTTPFRCLNLILILDQKDEPIGGPLTNELAIALKQKVSPIIISENVLYNFFALRQSLTPQAMRHLAELVKQNEMQLKELERQVTETYNTEELQNIDQAYQAKSKQIENKYHLIMNLLTQFIVQLPMRESAIQQVYNLAELLQKNLALIPEGRIKEEFQKILIMLQKISQSIRDYLTLASSHAQSKEEEFDLHEQQVKLFKKYETTITDLQQQIKAILDLATYEHNKELQTLALESKMALSEFKKKSDKLAEKKQEMSLSAFKVKVKQIPLFYSAIQFDLSDWLIFKHESNPLYILIPKFYIAQAQRELEKFQSTQLQEETKKEKESYSVKELAVGIAFEHETIMKKLPSSITLEKEFVRFMTDHMQFKMGIDALRESSWLPEDSPKINMEAIKECFIPKQFLERSFWNIYMSGHGMYKKVVSIEQRLQFINGSMDEAINIEGLLENVIAELPKMEQLVPEQEVNTFDKEMNRLFNAYLIAFNQNIFDPDSDSASLFLQLFLAQDPTIQDLIKYNAIDPIIENRFLLRIFLEKFLQQVKEMRKQLNDQRSKLEVSLKSGKTTEHAPTIAGLSLNQERDFLHFLSKSINTTFLYVVTCFGGGFNAEQIRHYLVELEQQQKKIFNQESSNFIVALGSLSDVRVHSFNLDEQLIPLNFAGFFSDLKKFYMREEVFGKDPLISILNNVVIRARGSETGLHGLSDIPLVYIPGTHLMRAVEIDKEIMVLTHAKLKALELIFPKKKEKVEPINTQGKSALIFYPTTINVPVHLGVDTKGHASALVPMAVDSSVFQFNRIDARAINLLTFLKESIIDFRSVMPRTFNINELTVANYNGSGLPGNGLIKLYNVKIKSFITPLKEAEAIEWKITFAMTDSQNKEIFYQGIIMDSYENPKIPTGRKVTDPVWKEITKEEAMEAAK